MAYGNIGGGTRPILRKTGGADPGQSGAILRGGGSMGGTGDAPGSAINPYFGGGAPSRQGGSVPGWSQQGGGSTGVQGGFNVGSQGGYTVGGSQGSSVGGSQQGTFIVPGMGDIYQQLLGMNQGNYQNILNAYAQGGQNLSQQLPGIYGGYQGVMSGVQGAVGQERQAGLQEIGAEFAQRQGQTTQAMTNAGLGNSTVGANLQNQNSYLQGRAISGLEASLAQQLGGAQMNVGLAGQSAQMQGAGMQSQMAQGLGGTLGHYNFGNTAGNLTGGFGSSFNQSQQSAFNQGQNWGQNYGQNFGVNQSQNFGNSMGGYQLPDFSGGYGGWPAFNNRTYNLPGQGGDQTSQPGFSGGGYFGDEAPAFSGGGDF